MSQEEEEEPSFLDNVEGDKRRNVKYRLDGGGEKLKEPLIGEFHASAAMPSTAQKKPPRSPRPPCMQPTYSPIAPRPRRPPPIENTANLLARINEIEKKHKEELNRKEMEIHFLRCSLGKTDQSLLDDVDLLMSKKLPKGWTDKLEKVSVMSSEAVEQEVGIRGAKNKVSAWEAKKPPIVTDPAGGARVMYHSPMDDELGYGNFP